MALRSYYEPLDQRPTSSGPFLVQWLHLDIQIQLDIQLLQISIILQGLQALQLYSVGIEPASQPAAYKDPRSYDQRNHYTRGELLGEIPP